MSVKMESASTCVTFTVELEVETAIAADHGPRSFVPETVRWFVTDGDRAHIKLSGPLVLASGGLSDKLRVTNTYWSSRTDIPAWLLGVVEDAEQSYFTAHPTLGQVAVLTQEQRDRIAVLLVKSEVV